MIDIIYNINAIKNVLKVNPKIIQSLYILNLNNKIFKMIKSAKEHNIKINYLTQMNNDAVKYISQTYKIIAKVHATNLIKNTKIIDNIDKILILYNIQDPHNLSSCIRSAEAFGIKLIIITEPNTVKITTLVNNISNGTALLLKILFIKNINKIIKIIKKNELYLIALSIKGTDKVMQKKMAKIALIMGSEKNGIKKAIMKQCDYTYKIRTLGKCNSINVAVATGIILNKIIKKI